MIRRITVQDILTEEELAKAVRIFQTVNAGEAHKRVRRELIVPNIERINAKIGQQNDPDYLAYVVEYVVMEGGAR